MTIARNENDQVRLRGASWVAIMPPCWANARGGPTIWPRVGLAATPPHPSKLLGLLAKPLLHRQKKFSLSSKSWDQIDIFP